MEDIFTLEETKALLVESDWKRFTGQSGYKRLIKENLKLYRSVLNHSQILEDTMKKYKHYSSSYNFSHRMMFIVERNADIESMKCSCGRTYNWTGHCRHCSELKDTLSRLSPEEKQNRIAKQSQTMRLKFGEEFRKEGKSPRYDLESINILQTFAEKHNLRLQHAEHGGEVYLRELGYWLDGYDSDRNIVVEIDEPFHFRTYRQEGQLLLLPKDIQRHKLIKEQLGCLIYRVYFNKRSGRVVLYNSPDQPDNWDVNKGIELTEFKSFSKNGTKQYTKYGV